MKRTNFSILKFRIPEFKMLFSGAILLIMFSLFTQNLGAQTPGSVLPTLKTKAQTQDVVNQQIAALTTASQQMTRTGPNDPAAIRISLLMQAYQQLDQYLRESQHLEVADMLYGIYPITNMFAPVQGNVNPTVNLSGFYNGQWNTYFAEIVDKIKA